MENLYKMLDRCFTDKGVPKNAADYAYDNGYLIVINTENSENVYPCSKHVRHFLAYDKNNYMRTGIIVKIAKDNGDKEIEKR